jgi:hypothetical protein
MLIDWGKQKDLYLIPEKDFNEIFEFTDKNLVKIKKGLKHGPHVGRLDSYICGHQFQHLKSTFLYGDMSGDPIVILGIYNFAVSETLSEDCS